MVTKSDYQRDEVDLCLSVLVEIMTVLNSFKNDIVIIGGWVPYFLIGKPEDQHIGSLDIDMAFNFKNISDESYKTIFQLLEARGYEKSDKQPFIFYRNVKGKIIEINLLAGEYGGTGKSRRTQKFQDVHARKARGCDLVFEETVECALEKEMPDGAVTSIRFKISNVVPFITTKGMALWDRYKEKDAYDIWFILKYHKEGIDRLAELFKLHKSNKLILEGLQKIRSKFLKIDSPGPVWTANFLEIDDDEEYQRIQRDSFERVNAFLDMLDIKPYQEM